MKEQTPPTAIPEIENESYWKKHTEALKISGLTRIDYCRLHQVNYDRFGYWVKRCSVSVKPLVAVKLKAAETVVPQVLGTLTLSGNRTLQIHDYATLAWILEKV